MAKCCRNVKFEEIDTDPSTGKSNGFWLLWGIFNKYIKQNIIMQLHCRLIRNWWCKKEDHGEKYI